MAGDLLCRRTGVCCGTVYLDPLHVLRYSLPRSNWALAFLKLGHEMEGKRATVICKQIALANSLRSGHWTIETQIHTDRQTRYVRVTQTSTHHSGSRSRDCLSSDHCHDSFFNIPLRIKFCLGTGPLPAVILQSSLRAPVQRHPRRNARASNVLPQGRPPAALGRLKADDCRSSPVRLTLATEQSRRSACRVRSISRRYSRPPPPKLPNWPAVVK